MARSKILEFGMIFTRMITAVIVLLMMLFKYKQLQMMIINRIYGIKSFVMDNNCHNNDNKVCIGVQQTQYQKSQTKKINHHIDGYLEREL